MAALMLKREDQYGGGSGFLQRRATSLFVTVVGSYLVLVVTVKCHRQARIHFYMERLRTRVVEGQYVAMPVLAITAPNEISCYLDALMP